MQVANRPGELTDDRSIALREGNAPRWKGSANERSLGLVAYLGSLQQGLFRTAKVSQSENRHFFEST